MHIYCLARGIKPALDRWENDLLAQYLPFEILEKGQTTPTPYLAQLQVRPVNLYEIVCPKSSEAVVMGMLKPQTDAGIMGKYGKIINLLRKALGLKKPITDFKNNLYK
jgi:hypothetical protein